MAIKLTCPEIPDGSGSNLFLLFLVFLVLKLTDVISWGWGWVCLPLYGGFLVLLVILLVSILLFCLSDRNERSVHD